MLTSHFSHTHWWIAALVAGAAAAMALQTLILEKKNKWKAVVGPLGAGVGIGLDSAIRGYEGNTPLQLYTLAMLSLALTRVVFAGHIGRMTALARDGQPIPQPTGRQIAIFILTVMAMMLTIAVTV
ncbi:hypothetical protein [Streptomyces sp. NPDC002328]|uniref:hypothetical protein n=1 Tax=Streptomyces sp. NPDC002328 TaxID=3364642 RepID=UPI00369D668A